MKLPAHLVFVLLIVNFATLVNSFEPVTITIGGIVGIGSILAATLWDPLHCRLFTCCNNRRIIKNFTGLEYDLKTKLHGQHLASWIVIQHIQHHLMADNPSKALVLSFHGPTGVGKTYVSSIIAGHMYKYGLRSNFVHLISAVRDFPHERMLPLYKNQLQAWIEGNVTNCDRSMFIFEEVDKLPAGFLDILVPYVEYRNNIRGINYRKAIFIILSNTGSTDIEKITLDHWKSGKVRETLEQSELQAAIVKAVSEDKDYGLWQSQLISRNLINAFIPFLPLEKLHVTKCIRDALLADNIVFNNHRQQKVVDEVLEHLTFYPQDEQVFVDTGCKRVSQKLYEVLG